MNPLGKLYGVGIGPGHPDLLTLRAVEIFKSVDVIYTVKGPKTELSISEQVVMSVENLTAKIVPLIFTMSKNMEERMAQIQTNADIIRKDLEKGLNTAFAVLGDTMTYSTFGYILQNIQESDIRPDIEIVPGITSFALLAAEANEVLVENNATLHVIPAYKNKSVDLMEFPPNSTTVLMKTYKSREAILDRLSQEEDIQVVYGEKLGSDEQYITNSIQDIQSRPETYLSLMLVKKR